MIARVKISPVERWCWWYKKGKTHPAGQRLVGLEVEIETASMRPAACDSQAKMWDISEKSNRQLEEICGGKSDWDMNRGVCNHFLEID